MRFIVSLFLLACTCQAQVRQFPWFENFAGAPVPALPAGWTTSTNRSSAGDFTTTTSTPHSDSVAVLSTNATIGQYLITPVFDFTSCDVESLTFFERRSASHNSGVLLEASADGGSTFAIPIADTLKNPGVTSYVRRSFRLPPILSRQGEVRIRWRVVGNGSGSTGTLRLDDIGLTTLAETDLTVTAVSFSPPFPAVGDSVRIDAVVKNVGRLTVGSVSVNFSEDADGDGTADSGELFSTYAIPDSIMPGDSTVGSAQLNNLRAGPHPLIVEVFAPGDQNQSNNITRVTLDVGCKAGTVVVNEIMYSPQSPEPEWVELTNASADTVDLRRWSIADRSSRYRFDSTAILLPPARFLVVTKDSGALRQRHPRIDRILGVGAMPSSLWNNDSDAVALYDQRGALMDSVFYRAKWGGTSGRSLERREITGLSTDPSNWGSSIHPDSSTPGFKNSLTKKENDLGVGEIRFTPGTPSAGDDVTIYAVVLNKGKNPASGYTIEFYEDLDGDSVPEASEIIYSQIGGSELAADDSAFFTAGQSGLSFGLHHYFVRIIYLDDEDTSNNWRGAMLIAGYSPGTIVINEVVAIPAAGEPEWIELFNTRNDTVDGTSWRISNRNSSSRYLISGGWMPFAPHEYLVLTKDTALFRDAHPSFSGRAVQSPSLPTFLFNNSGDAVAIFDERGATMDSMRYSSGWCGPPGVSLERIEVTGSSIDSANWMPCGDTGHSTPGRQNYATPLDYNLRAVRVFWESGIVRTVVANIGRQAADSVRVLLFHDADADSTIHSLELLGIGRSASPLPPRDSVSIELGLEGQMPGMMHLIAMIDDTLDMRASDNLAYGVITTGANAGELIVNEIMYDPLPGQSEYVELYNRGDRPLNVTGWKLSGRVLAPSPAGGVQTSMLVERSGYLVIAGDSAIFSTYPALRDSASKVVVVKGGLGLNNGGDDAVVRDLVGNLIDSVRYIPSWHNPDLSEVSGKSLERISPDVPGTDARNWSTSADPAGGTPGRRNSLFAASIPAATSLSISPNPFSPDGDGRDDVTMLSYELPAAAAVIRARIFDSRGRIVRTLADGEASGSHGQLIWDGYSDDRMRVRMGIYVILLEGLDASGAEVQAAKGLVVVAAKM